MVTVEVACVAMGNTDCCRFVVAHKEKIGHYVDFYLAASNSGHLRPSLTLLSLFTDPSLSSEEGGGWLPRVLQMNNL